MRSCEPSINDHNVITDNNTESDFSVAGFNRFNASQGGNTSVERELIAA